MKIEKLSDTQIKFILDEEDLRKRDLKITELAYGSEKTQSLFHEMMRKAMAKYGFEVDNIPLMIEAIPITSTSIVIIVTKVKSPTEIEEKFNLKQSTLERSIFKPNEFRKQKEKIDNKILLFSFDNLDNVTLACIRLKSLFDGKSKLFKQKNKYLLYIESLSDENEMFNVNLILSEYGNKQSSNKVTINYLYEHCEIIVEDYVIDILTKYLK